MTPRDFTYWLKGFFEITGQRTLSEHEVTVLKDHLDLVMEKHTPHRDCRTDSTLPFPEPELPRLTPSRHSFSQKLIC